MNRNIVIGIVVVIALAVLGWWYWAMMRPAGDTDMMPFAPEESVNGVARPDTEIAVELAGTWESTQDSRFIREFRADGTVIDRYEGDESATTQGSWNFVADPASERAELPVVKDAKILKIQFSEEVLYFALTGLSSTELSMIYLQGNGTLEFRRVHE